MSFDRHNPFAAKIVDKRLLTSAQSARPTLHIALSLAGSGITHEPGDLVALFVENEPALVDAVLKRLELDGAESITIPGNAALKDPPKQTSLRQALTSHLSLGALPLRLVRAAADAIEDDDEAIAIEELCDDDTAFDAYVMERDLLDFLQEHPTLSFEAQELATLLPALQPRTYSIASSPKQHPDEVHLVVGLIEWTRNGRVRHGVASAHLSRANVGDTIPLYATASKHFRLPDVAAPLVLIGPGTGIAPFRGFWQHGHGAPVWLLFGAQTRQHDFYYQDELDAAQKAGAITRLDLAFSRDQAERVYVQHRLREAADEVWAWLERGAYVYVCGSSTMAPDVERTLVEIATAHGAPADWWDRMKSDKRYRRDVY